MTKGSLRHNSRSAILREVSRGPPHAVAVITCRFIGIFCGWRASCSAILDTALHQERIVALNSKVSHFITATTNSGSLYVCLREIKWQ